MDIALLFTILLGGVSVLLFIVAFGLAELHTTGKPSKVVVYSYILAITFMILAIIAFQFSSFTL